MTFFFTKGEDFSAFKMKNHKLSGVSEGTCCALLRSYVLTLPPLSLIRHPRSSLLHIHAPRSPPHRFTHDLICGSFIPCAYIKSHLRDFKWLYIAVR